MNETKNDTKKNGTYRGGLLPFRRPSRNNGEQLQVDIGDYQLYIGEDLVGEVFVAPHPEHSTDPLYSVEHWVLFSNYTWPSETNDRVTIEFKYREGVYGSVQDFLSWAEGVSNSRYVMASCHEQSL